MCGVAGFLDMCSRVGQAEAEANAAAMAEPIRPRGPDDEGCWADASAGIALSFRRLAIVDLTESGHQPMHSATGRFVIVYNGEVYNFERIRKQLANEGHAPAFRGHSDTEVILAAVEAWGLEKSLERFIGMFAIALWDRHERRLHLVRDRLGVKPLYYGWFGDTLLFGSELKALRAFPGFRPDIDRDMLTLLLRYNNIPAPHTIYRSVYKLPPGHVLTVSADHRGAQPTPFWSARAIAENGIADPFRGSAEEATGELDALLRDAVALRMIADVPLGVFLSGGVDSSTVVALMQAQSSRPVKTFSIGFHESGYNEARDAKAVAAHLGTEHTELYVTSAEALAVIPQLPNIYDEPFADSSQIPTYLLSMLTRRHVTVSLSGDGGDEVFGGYNRYSWGPSIWKKVGWMPRWMRGIGARAITALPPGAWDGLLRRMGSVLPRRFQQRNPGDKVAKLADVLAVNDPDSMYRTLVADCKDPTSVVRGGTEPTTVVLDRRTWTEQFDITRRMMLLDLVTYLPDDILAKVDRASMAVSLEVRVPLLDHRVVEFAWRLPLDMKIREGQSKWLLRQVLYRYVPRQLIERPKTGFAIPLDQWLRGPLRDWAESLLDEQRLAREGFFHPDPIRSKWQDHLSGRRSWHRYLWNVLMFQAWRERWAA